LAIVVLLLITFILFKNTPKEHEKNIFLANYYSYHEQWDKVVGVAVSDPKYDVYINFFYNRAIANTGHFFDLYFDYPQLAGAQILYPDDNFSSPMMAMSISNYYFDLGYISEAHHWANAALAVFPNNQEAIKRLVIINLIYGNYLASHDLLKALSNSFFTKEFIHHYMPYTKDTNLIASDSLIMEKRKSMPTNKLTSEFLDERFKDLLKQNPNNKLAYEHLQMNYLLKHEFNHFLGYLPEGRRFYSKRPELFDEVILIQLLQTDRSKIKNIKFDPVAQKRIQDFFVTLKNFEGKKEAAQAELYQKYGNCYLYYLMYNSPLVTKASIKGSSEKYKL
jgi:hypothetical protein